MMSPIVGKSRNRLVSALVMVTVGVLFLLCAADDGAARERGRSIREKKPAKAQQVKKKPVKAQQVKKKAPAAKRDVIQARAAFCVDLANANIIFSREADRPLPVASLTKLVTALVVLDHMPLDREVVAPDSVTHTPKSVVGLRPGDKVTVKELLHGLLIRSGNDCAETLAEAFKGGKSKFIEAMNAKALSLGAKRTRFYTPSGLDLKTNASDAPGDGEKVKSNVSTAKEIALIAREAFSQKTIRDISLKKHYVIRRVGCEETFPVRNTNKLLKDNLPLEGGKTGYTNKAGHCLASRFSSGRSDFVIVVLGSTDHFRDTKLIFRNAVKKTADAPKALRHTTQGAEAPRG